MVDSIVLSFACDLNLTVTNKNSNEHFLSPRCPQGVFNVIKELKRLEELKTLKRIFIQYLIR